MKYYSTVHSSATHPVQNLKHILHMVYMYVCVVILVFHFQSKIWNRNTFYTCVLYMYKYVYNLFQFGHSPSAYWSDLLQPYRPNPQYRSASHSPFLVTSGYTWTQKQLMKYPFVLHAVSLEQFASNLMPLRFSSASLKIHLFENMLLNLLLFSHHKSSSPPPITV